MGTTVYLVFQDIDRDLAQFWQKGELTLVNGSISSTAVHIAFQNTVHGSFFREKQTAVHIAFQTTVHGSFFFF